MLKRPNTSKNSIYFVDESPDEGYLNCYSVVNLSSFLNIFVDERHIAIAIANSKVRHKLTEECLKNNIKPMNVKASNVVILDEIIIDSGSILCSFVTLTSNIRIGKQFHANIYSYIAHDCVIGDYVTFAPSVRGSFNNQKNQRQSNYRNQFDMN